MRTAVIGVGVAGSSHLFDLVSNGEFDVVAVCASRMETAQRAACLFSVPAVCRDVSELLDIHRPEAVVIATPPHVTPDILAICLAAGSWVVVDKPAGPDARSLRKVITSVGTLASRARVTYNRRYQEHIDYARSAIVGDDLGALIAVDCYWTGPFTRRYASPDTYRKNVGFGNGVVLDTACHIFDTLAMLGLGSPTVQKAKIMSLPTGADISAEIRLIHGRQDTPITVSIRDSGQDDAWQIIIRGESGHLELNREGLRGRCQGLPVIKQATSVRHPVDDLLFMRRGQPTYGATLHQAVNVLETIDQIRDASAFARAKRPWQRPRAKALGRLNGAC
jgi:predicted dehydrogenase